MWNFNETIRRHWHVQPSIYNPFWILGWQKKLPLTDCHTMFCLTITTTCLNSEISKYCLYPISGEDSLVKWGVTVKPQMQFDDIHKQTWYHESFHYTTSSVVRIFKLHFIHRKHAFISKSFQLKSKQFIYTTLVCLFCTIRFLQLFKLNFIFSESSTWFNHTTEMIKIYLWLHYHTLTQSEYRVQISAM